MPPEEFALFGNRKRHQAWELPLTTAFECAFFSLDACVTSLVLAATHFLVPAGR